MFQLHSRPRRAELSWSHPPRARRAEYRSCGAGEGAPRRRSGAARRAAEGEGDEKEKAVAAEQAWTMAEKAAVEKREQQLAAVSPLPNNGPSSTWRTLCRTRFVVSGATRLRWTVTGMRPLDAQRRTVVPAHAARAPHCGRSGAGFGSILRVVITYVRLSR